MLKTSDRRVSLSSEMIRNDLHVSKNMGDLDSFYPSQAALDWLTSKNRHARPPEKAKQHTEAEDHRQTKKGEMSKKPNLLNSDLFDNDYYLEIFLTMTCMYWVY